MNSGLINGLASQPLRRRTRDTLTRISPTSSGVLIPNTKNGKSQAITLTGNVSIPKVAGPASNGDVIRLLLTASGADRTLTSALATPSDSLVDLVNGKTLTSGKTYRLVLERQASAWVVLSLVGGYA